MTIEEAITIIDNLHLIGCGRNQHEDDLKINVALDMAIEALSAEAEYSKLLQTALNGIPIVDLTDGKTKPSAEIPTESTNTPTNTPTDLISRADAIEAICNAQCELDVPHYPQCDQVKWCDEVKALLALPSADAVKRVDCSNFLLWLLEEIMDEENWELNAVADGEIIARKLKKLGLLEVKDGYYHRIFDENVWVVRCKDCRHRDLFSCPLADNDFQKDDDYCSWGERR